ncbi:hypothetical protein C8Q80DRAFT_598489 [Daedaleopsis nitida]|nr:hypothetical protein C8Q80DRAFT_598489 [Daedaleopsis nitida]
MSLGVVQPILWRWIYIPSIPRLLSVVSALLQHNSISVMACTGQDENLSTPHGISDHEMSSHVRAEAQSVQDGQVEVRDARSPLSVVHQHVATVSNPGSETSAVTKDTVADLGPHARPQSGCSDATVTRFFPPDPYAVSRRELWRAPTPPPVTTRSSAASENARLPGVPHLKHKDTTPACSEESKSIRPLPRLTGTFASYRPEDLGRLTRPFAPNWLRVRDPSHPKFRIDQIKPYLPAHMQPDYDGPRHPLYRVGGMAFPSAGTRKQASRGSVSVGNPDSSESLREQASGRTATSSQRATTEVTSSRKPTTTARTPSHISGAGNRPAAQAKILGTTLDDVASNQQSRVKEKLKAERSKRKATRDPHAKGERKRYDRERSEGWPPEGYAILWGDPTGGPRGPRLWGTYLVPADIPDDQTWTHLHQKFSLPSAGVCLWHGCGMDGNLKAVTNLRRHVETVHLRLKLECVECGRHMRADHWRNKRSVHDTWCSQRKRFEQDA